MAPGLFFWGVEHSSMWGRTSPSGDHDSALAGEEPTRATWLPFDPTEIVDLSIGSVDDPNPVFAVLSDGSVWAWGYNWLGLDTETLPVQMTLPDHPDQVHPPFALGVAATFGGGAATVDYGIPSGQSIVAWGYARGAQFGQHGSGSDYTLSTPTLVLDDDGDDPFEYARRIAMGENEMLVVGTPDALISPASSLWLIGWGSGTRQYSQEYQGEAGDTAVEATDAPTRVVGVIGSGHLDDEGGSGVFPDEMARNFGDALMLRMSDGTFRMWGLVGQAGSFGDGRTWNNWTDAAGSHIPSETYTLWVYRPAVVLGIGGDPTPLVGLADSETFCTDGAAHWAILPDGSLAAWGFRVGPTYPDASIWGASPSDSPVPVAFPTPVAFAKIATDALGRQLAIGSDGLVYARGYQGTAGFLSGHPGTPALENFTQWTPVPGISNATRIWGGAGMFAILGEAAEDEFLFVGTQIG